MDYHDYPPTQQPAPKVLVTRHLPSGPLDLLRASCTVDLYDSREQMPREAFLDRIGKVDGVICQLTDIFDRQAIERGYSLRVISDVSVGYDNVDIAYARRRSIIVTHTPDVLTDATANLTWALILGITRRVVEGDRLVRRGGWKGFAFDFMLGADLAGKRLGILGMGRIGQEVAKRGRAFGMDVVYVPGPRKGQRKTPQRFPGFQASPVTFDELLATSDVLSIHVPLTPETRHMIDHRALARMKRSACLVNVARGPIVDEEALAWALREGIISGAGLDVYEDEPNVHPGLLGLENVVLAPHLGSATVETRTAMARLAVENCIAVLFGRQPPTPVPEMRDMKPY